MYSNDAPGGARVPLQPLSAAVLALALLPPTAFAQGRATALEEVIVTAQKRVESLQDAPIAVSALSGAQSNVLPVPP